MFDFLKTIEKKEAVPGEKKSKLEVTLKEVGDLSAKAKAQKRVEKVSEKGKFLKLGSHKVTGKELNAVTAHIDESIIQTKNVQIETLQHIVQLYQALDALDEEHIAGILSAIKAAEVATDLARINDENIGKITNYLMQDERILAYKKEQDDKIASLVNKLKTAYYVAGGALVVAFVSLALCFTALF